MKADYQEYSLAGTKVASGMKPSVVVTTGKKRLLQ